MRLFNILLLLLMSTAFATAQVTIDPSDAPPVGATFNFGTDTLLFKVGPGGEGEGLTWDFSNFDTDVSVITTSLDPADTPTADLFPEADVVLETEGLYSYADINDDGLFGLGGTAPQQGIIFTVAFDPAQQLLANPTSFGTAFTNDFGFELELDGEPFGVDSVRVVENGDLQAEVSASGTLILPAGTFEVLRLSKVTNTTDSVYIKFFGTWILGDVITSTTYTSEWWAEGGLGTIATMETDASGNALSVQFLTDFSLPAVQPTAAFSSEITGNGTVQFTDESLNTPEEWQWDFGDGNTSDLQNPEHSYTASGTYTVCLTVTNEAGSDVACEEVSIVISSSSNLSISEQVYLYPNPTTGPLSLYMDEAAGKEVSIAIYNLNGQALLQLPPSAVDRISAYDLSHLPTGEYLFEITLDGQRYKSLKFLKK
jgi:PKD repeat protein